MLEQETAQIITDLLRRTIGQKDQIGLHDILAGSLPRGIKAYLRAEVTRWLTDELRQGRRFGALVQGDAQNRGASVAIVSSASLEYVFPRAEFVTTLDQAVHFLGNYLCRPRWTLRQFLTPGTTPAPAGLVDQRLAYLSDYAYLPTLIGRYLRSRGLTTISPAQLGSLVEQIDHLVVQRGTYADLARLTRPMFEFFALAFSAGAGIPLKPVLVFLGDKQQETLQDHLEHLCRLRGTDTLTFGDFVGALNGLDDIARAHTVQRSPSIILTPLEQPEAEEASPVLSETGAGELPASLPADDTGPAPSDPPRPEPRTTAGDSRNVPLSLTFAGLESTNVGQEFSPLESFICDEQRRFFIDAIFDRDPAFYAGVIDALNRTPSWSEAAGYLRGLFESHGVDPLSDEALEFVEAVQLRYRSGGS